MPRYGSVLITPDHLRQVFNDADAEVLCLIIGAPEEAEFLPGVGTKPGWSLIYPVGPTQLTKEPAGVRWPPGVSRLTNIARCKHCEGTDFIIHNRLRNRDTIEGFGVWERLNGPGSNPIEFDGLENKRGSRCGSRLRVSASPRRASRASSGTIRAAAPASRLRLRADRFDHLRVEARRRDPRSRDGGVGFRDAIHWLCLHRGGF